MISRLLAFVSIFILVSSVFAQPDSLWSRTYGGEGDERCYSVFQTSDGGLALAGITDSFGAGNHDFWLVQTDSNGDSLWSRAYGGSNEEYCMSVLGTSEGGYLLAGSTNSFGSGDFDFWLLWTDSNGDSLTSRTFGGSGEDFCYAAQKTADGGYALAGYTDSFGSGTIDFWLIKVNSEGDSLWSRSYGGMNWDECSSIQQTADNGYILAGFTRSPDTGYSDFRLVRTDANGDSLWSQAYGGQGDDLCTSALQSSNGNYLLTGYTSSFGNDNRDSWIVRINEDGDSLWSITFGGSGDDYFESIHQTIDYGFIVAGTTLTHSTGRSAFWLMRTDINGDSLWSRTFASVGWGSYCKSVQQTIDGGYVLAGKTYQASHGDVDFLLVKTGPDPIMDTDEYYTPQASSYSLSAYPNPFNSELTLDVSGFSREVRISLLNVLGQEVEIIHDGVLSGNRIHYAAPATMSSGLYFVQARDAREIRTAKVVFLK